jgi:hypothetical protein
MGRPKTGNAKDKKLTIKITEEQRQRFKEEASKFNLSVSQYVLLHTIDSKKQ